MSILDRFRLDSRVAIVTGASSGLGAAFALGLAEAGATTAIGARRSEGLARTQEAIAAVGGTCLSQPLDVTDADACDRFVADVVEQTGRVDILVNNAGLSSMHPATRESPEDFRSVVEVNLLGSYWMAQACGRRMGPGSSIINVSSILATTTDGLPHAAYTASKAGVDGLTRDLARQWSGRKGIRVNALVPGYFPSEMTDLYDQELLARAVQRSPLGRMGESEELVSALVFLVSDAGSYVTGASLPVDGGVLVG